MLLCFFWCVLCEVSFRWYRPPNLTLGWWQSVWFIYACQILEKKFRNSKISGAKSLLLSRVGFSCWRCELFIFSSRHCFVVFLVTPALFYFFDVFIIGVTRFAFLLHDHIPMCLHTVACWDCFPKDCHGRRKNCSWRLFCFRWRLLCIIIIVYSKFLKSYAHSFVSAVLV